MTTTALFQATRPRPRVMASLRSVLVRAARGSRTLPWGTILPFAVAMTAADAFWEISLRGTVGAIERSQSPLADFIRESIVLLPLVLGGVLAAVLITRRRYGVSAPGAKPTLFTLALSVIAGSVIGVVALVANAAIDYHLQAVQLHQAHATHSTAVSGENLPGFEGVGHSHDSGIGCSGTCIFQRQTLDLHIQSVKLVGPMVAGTNLVLVGWLTAARGGRLDPVRRRRRTSAAA